MPFFSSSARCSDDRPRRAAVLIHDDGGDALRDEIRRRAANRIRIAEAAARTRAIVCVRVNVDEAGRDVLARGVDHARGLARPRAGRRSDAAAAHADVSGEPGIARAVHHAAVANQEIEPLRRLRGDDRQESADKRDRKTIPWPFDQVLISAGPLCMPDKFCEAADVDLAADKSAPDVLDSRAIARSA